MLFCTLSYLYFFTAVFTVYWLMPWHRARVWLLLGASFTFYASWNKWLALLIGVSTVVDYFLARGMEAFDRHPEMGQNERLIWRRVLLAISLVGNLGLLF